MRSLAGIGTTIRNTRTQIMQLSGRQVPIAGATGVTTSDDQPAPEPVLCPTPFSKNKESYAVRFIQHSPEQPSTSSLTLLDVDHDLSDEGYALKLGPGKRTAFSQAQKDIMAELPGRRPWAKPNRRHGKSKQTHEVIFLWLSLLPVLLAGAYARQRRRSRATWRP